LIGFTVVFKSFGGPLILKLTPKIPSPILSPIKIFPNKGMDAIDLFIVVAGTNVPLKLTNFLFSIYPSINIETAGPIAYISSMFVRPFCFEKFISKSVNLIPSPVNKSAIPCNEAKLKSFAKIGTSLTLKLSMVSNDLEIPNYLESKFEAQIQRVTNDTYLKVFQHNLFDTPVMPVSQSTMNSNIKLYLEQESQILTTGIEIYENLGIKHSDRYQYTLPYYDFSKNLTSLISDNLINGSLNFYSTGTNKLLNTNNLRTTVVNDFNYSSNDFISKLGFKNNFNLYFKNLNVVGKNDSSYSSNLQMDGMNILNIASSYPLLKYNDTIKETLTPKVSVRVNPMNNMNNYKDSTRVITANNVFDINRLGITNDFEAGKSLTFGLDYKYDPLTDNQSEDTDNDLSEDINKKLSEIPKDKYLEIKLATVIRDKNEDNIPFSSTLNRKNSDLFGSIENKLLNNVDLLYEFSLDNDMRTINSSSIETEISINNFITTFNYIEQRNEIGSTHLLSNTTEYKIDDSKSLKFSTRRNKKINLTEYYDLSYEYKNDCLTAAIKFNKSFYKDKDLKPTEDLFFTITLIPLTTYEREIYKKTPGQSGLKGWFR